MKFLLSNTLKANIKRYKDEKQLKKMLTESFKRFILLEEEKYV